MTHTSDRTLFRHAPVAALVLACMLALPSVPVLAGQTASGAISGASAATTATAATTAATAAAASPGAAEAPGAASDPAPAPAATVPAPAATPEQQAALAGARPAAPIAMQPPTAGGSLLQTTLSLIVVLAVLVGLAWVLKRYGPKTVTGSANVKLVGALSVGARERILVVEVGEQWIVVGASPGRMNALATMPRQEAEFGPPSPAAGSGHVLPSANFAEWFKQTIEKRNGK
jgi:flagellar protein FliO/FliZ